MYLSGAQKRVTKLIRHVKTGAGELLRATLSHASLFGTLESAVSMSWLMVLHYAFK
jgi:hypothetical protein